MASLMALLIDVPRIHFGQWIEEFINSLVMNGRGFFDTVKTVVESLINGLASALQFPDPVILALVFALLGLLVRGWVFAAGSFVGLVLIISLGQWPAAMAMLALVVVAALIALLIGIPLGILAARSKIASSIIRPVMDLMQTMPAFVWLIPVVMLFGIGVTPGMFAMIIFALPPGVRLTELGIRNVDAEVVEAAHAFGATPRQTLTGVQLPLALPTIMAGVNQVIMLSLSMAVIAGLVGAEGLGGNVTGAVQNLQVGLGFEAGLSVVILAIYLDRLTGSVGQGKGGLIGTLRKLRPNNPVDPVEGTPTTEPDKTAEIEHAKGHRHPPFG